MTEVHFDKAHYQLRLRISTERFTFAVYDPEVEPSFILPTIRPIAGIH